MLVFEALLRFPVGRFVLFGLGRMFSDVSEQLILICDELVNDFSLGFQVILSSLEILGKLPNFNFKGGNLFNTFRKVVGCSFELR